MNAVKFGHFFVLAALPAVSGSAVSAQAQSLEVPVMERVDGDFDTCAFGEVAGLARISHTVHGLRRMQAAAPQGAGRKA